jgi:hypothetical protein
VTNDIPTDDFSAVRRAQTAIRNAVGRTRQAEGSQDSDLIFVGYVETVMWFCALDDLLEQMETETYAKRRDADSGGRVLRGLRWARNQGVHQLMSLHRIAGGLTFPMTFPARFDIHAVWLERSETAPRARRQPSNEVPYEQYVAGRSVAETIGAAQQFLWERAIPGFYKDQLPWG